MRPPPLRMSNIGYAGRRCPSFQNDDQNRKGKMMMKISSSSSKSSSSHFFQIIHSSIIQSKILVLPKKFIRNFGEDLSKVAVFMVPCGTIWRIELKKADGKISFEGGWQEFMDYYSIRVGHFLLFKYDGNSYFNVVIFDISASEIEYPCHTTDYEEPNHESESQAPATLEANSMEIPNISFPWLTRNEDDERDVKVLANKENELDQVEQIIYENCTFPLKDPEVISIQSDSSQSTDECTMYSLRDETDEVTAGLFKPKSRRTKVSACRVNRGTEPDGHDDLFLREKVGGCVPTTRSYSTASRVAQAKRALVAARAFKSENPFCTIIMQPSYVEYHFCLRVPFEFGKVYLKQKTDSVTLRISDGGTWRVRCSFGDTYTRFMKGWKDFAVENHLEQCDVCVFELVDRNNFEMNVYIFRASMEIPNIPFPRLTRNEDDKREVKVLANKQNELDQVEQIIHENCTFPELISIQSDSSQSSDETEEVTADLLKQKSRRTKASACRVNRGTESNGRNDLFLREKADASVPTTKSYSAQAKRALEAARAFKSENPFCMIVMQPSYVGKHFGLNVPFEFGKVYLKQKTDSVTLRILDGGTWQVRCSFGDTYSKFVKGWKDFAVENHLELSDVCVFELVDRNNFEMNVYIFRASGDVL